MDAVREDMQVVGVRVKAIEKRLKKENSDSLWRPLERDKSLVNMCPLVEGLAPSQDLQSES